jgi:phosphonate transport system substrate-binding protein
MRLRKESIVILSLFLFFLICRNLHGEQDTITIGYVSDDPQQHYQRFKAFVDYIAKNLEYMGIRKGKVLLAKDNHQLIKYLRENKVDIVNETPYSTIIYMEKAGLRPLLRAWKKGVPRYNSYIFIRKDSGINSLKDLRGKVIAFEDPGSTTGYFLPKIAIIKEGLEMVELKDYTQKPPADKVGYCFAQGEPNVAHWVHKGLANAGALSNIDFQEADKVPPNFLIDFKVIYESEPVPRNVISVRGEMDPNLREEIKNILLNMAFTEEGKRIMWKLARTICFDEFPEGTEEVIKSFTEKYILMKEEIEEEYPE